MSTAAISLKLTDTIGLFRGEGEDFSEWIKKFELVLTLQGTTDFGSVLPLFLSGQAFSVFDTLDQKDKKNYKIVRSSLTRAFSLDRFSAYEAFVSRRFQHGEAIDVYLSDLRRFGRLVFDDLSEEWLKCAFVAGLPDSVKVQLKSATSVDSLPLSEVVERARIILTATNSTAGMMAKTSIARSKDPRKGSTTTTADKRGCCFVCGEASHFARRCPRRRRSVKCFACGEEGHLASDCPNRSTKEPKNE